MRPIETNTTNREHRMSDFKIFGTAVNHAFNTLVAKDGKTKDNLFVVDVTGDELWAQYLGAFPEGTNPMFRERTEHDCSCCRNFVKNLGAVVYVKGQEFLSVWDLLIEDELYSVVAKAMSEFVKSKSIANHFLVSEENYGAQTTSTKGETWNHFFAKVPKIFLAKQNQTNYIGSRKDDVNILRRSILEISDEAVDIVSELIAQNSLYRGEEHKGAVALLSKMKREYKALATEQEREFYLWTNAKPNTRIRNTVIGTLLTDISEGVELERAVSSFEAKVAPANYKRPTALVTQRMIDEARKTVEELGIEASLSRRYAVREDISVNDVLFVDGNVKPKLLGGAFDAIKPTKKNVPSLSNVEDIGIADFLANVLPMASELEVFVKNQHTNNFVSLVAPEHADADPLFKWDNGFSWSYVGELADSDIRRAVQAKGGRVDGVLRFSHSWNYDKRNASLMDLHVFMPGCEHTSGKNDNFGTPNGQRVGWNNRTDRTSGGVQDVDYVDAAPVGYVPVENITFPDIKRLKDGKYQCKIHNWALRSPTQGGFKAEIEFAGQVFEYEYDKPLGNKEWIDVATVTLKNGVFSIEHHMPVGAASKGIWNIQTEDWTPVDLITRSPNFWNGKQVGNEHVFFMLKGCVNEEGTRGFYNEYLRDELIQHRKVFEVLASSLKVGYNANQLSGVGFSTTKRDEILVRVKGSINRVLNVKF